MDSADRWYAGKALGLLLAPVPVACVNYHATGFSFCLFTLITGHHCYGCGLVRGMSAVLHGDFSAAWRLNPLNAVTIPLLTWLYLRELVLVTKRKIIRSVHPMATREVGELDRLKS